MDKLKKALFIILSFSAMLAVTCVIFSYSGKTGPESTEQSDALGKFVTDVLHIEVPEGQSPSSVPIVANFNIRNCAHIFLFSLLGLTSFLFVSSLFALRPARDADSIFIVLASSGISLLYAVIDEFHQSFIDGRAAKASDIGMDAIGFCSSIALCCALYFVFLYFIGRLRAAKAAEANAATETR